MPDERALSGCYLPICGSWRRKMFTSSWRGHCPRAAWGWQSATASIAPLKGKPLMPTNWTLPRRRWRF